ncbi:MAG: MFS transporter [Porticoccaceae bacterium]|nr:MFS transporter [Porticoccaceae bacterium]
MTSETPEQPPEKAENLLINLLFNIIAPTLILTKLSSDAYLGTTNAIVIALAFPVIYGIHDMVRRGKVNLFSVIGVFSILMTGGISLLGLAPKYLALKEAAVPATFGLATLVSVKTPYPLVKTFIYNDAILNTALIKRTLSANGNEDAFERRLLMASLLIAGSFFLSSVLNYLLAIMVVTSQPGTVEYNEQLGKMTALSFPVIALPATVVMMGAMLYLFKGITRLTGLDLEQIIKHRTKD